MTPSTGGVEAHEPEGRHDSPVARKLDHIVTELARHGWPVDPVDPDAPDTVLVARLAVEERRLRAMTEAM